MTSEFGGQWGGLITGARADRYLGDKTGAVGPPDSCRKAKR